jgi:hypothetical protein
MKSATLTSYTAININNKIITPRLWTSVAADGDVDV